MAEFGKFQCCVVGGGPAGMMLGALLARAGISVVVLEKHSDFLRDFRGDTVHPSTLEVMAELGWLEDFLRRPHQKVAQLRGFVEDQELVLGNFSAVPGRCKYVAFMPQWDFLNFIEERARKYSNFQVKMDAEVTDLLQEDGRVTGVRVKTPQGESEILADLVVAADGRNSLLREKAGLKIQDLGAPMDILWMKIPRLKTDPDTTMGWFRAGYLIVFIYRGDYWQCGFVIRKGGFEAMKGEGIQSFREKLARAAPFLADRVNQITSFQDIRLLVVKVDRLKRWWRSGLICIGDSAHAMSPIGGVGINLAIQDAVAAANLLTPFLKKGQVPDDILEAVQRRREFPTRMTQRLQILVQERVIDHVLFSGQSLKINPVLKFLSQFKFFQSIPGFLVGWGFRPEHVLFKKSGHQ